MPNYVVNPEFDIIIHSHNNIEWLDPLLFSLARTMKRKNRRIYIVDDSSDNSVDFLQTYDLNVCIRRLKPEEYEYVGIDPERNLKMGTIQECKGDTICWIDADVVMLRPYWDLFVEEQIKAGYTAISSSIRANILETSFLVASKDLFAEARALHMAEIKGFDPSVPLNRGQNEDEHLAFTYFDELRGGKRLLLRRFRPVSGPYSRWGFVTIKYDVPFLYHNFYGGRCKRLNTIPLDELIGGYNRIMLAPDNARLLKSYMVRKYPTDIGSFMDKYDTFSRPSDQEIESLWLPYQGV